MCCLQSYTFLLVSIKLMDTRAMGGCMSMPVLMNVTLKLHICLFLSHLRNVPSNALPLRLLKVLFQIHLLQFSLKAALIIHLKGKVVTHTLTSVPLDTLNSRHTLNLL